VGDGNSGDAEREGECGAEGAGGGNGKIKKLIWKGAEGKEEREFVVAVRGTGEDEHL